MPSLLKIQKELRCHASGKRKQTNEWFFKTGKDQYGAGDVFIGVSMPDIRKVAKTYVDVSFSIIEQLLYSPFHEERMLALVILTNQFEIADTQQQKLIYRFYLKHRKQVNNWDLVDVSAHKIVGMYLLDHPKDKSILDTLAVSKSLWDRRIAMLATWSFIRVGKVSDTLRLARKFFGDQEDLMHKAVGWMLREAWKKEPEKIERFLEKHYTELPRTTLRYAIERISENKRKNILEGIF